MDKFIFCCTLFAVIFIEGIQCKSRGRVKQGVDTDVKIVGGNETTIETYPYQAYLSLYNGSDYTQCGGSIISRDYIVTAAHCLAGIQKINVRIGSTSSSSGGTEYETTTFMSHPMYNNRTYDYDVGLVRVTERMNLDGTNTRAVRMAQVGNDPTEREEVIITGWGTTAENGSVSDTLMVAQIPVVSRGRCNELLNNTITRRMFCAGVTDGGKDTCEGDYGGPAVLSSSGTLAGIASFGYGCARPNSPSVYTLIGNIYVRLFIRYNTGY